MLLGTLNLLKRHRNYAPNLFARSFFEKYKGGDIKYEREPEKDDRPHLLRIKDNLKVLKEEIILWKEEIKEDIQNDPKIYVPGDTEIMWKFNSQEELKKWIVTSDKDNEDGYSECSLALNKYNHGFFEGTLNTTLPKDGRVTRSGYCNITAKKPKKSFYRDNYFEIHPFTHLVLRIRGDGRSYSLCVLTGGFYDITWHDTFNFILYTRGGPYWQTARVPFSKFFLCSKARIQDKQGTVAFSRVKGIGITCADKNPGPFQLEIDYIGMYWDPNHREEFAYEMYYYHPYQLY